MHTDLKVKNSRISNLTLNNKQAFLDACKTSQQCNNRSDRGLSSCQFQLPLKLASSSCRLSFSLIEYLGEL